MRHYLTTAAAHLLPQLRALHASMRRHCGDFRLHVLTESPVVMAWCLDRHQDVASYAVADLLARHPELPPDRLPGPQRTPRECAITWRWWLLADLLEAGVGPITSLDVDLWFFSSPEPVFEEIGDAAMAVLPHGFAPASAGLPGVTMESHRKYALFNAGWVTFADLGPLAEFAEACRQGPISELDQPDENGVVIGEQAALERLAKKHGAHMIQHPGAAPGPWCANAQPLTQTHDGTLFFGGRRLVAWHFHSLRVGQQLADANYEIQPRMVEALYAPYLAALTEES